MRTIETQIKKQQKGIVQDTKKQIIKIAGQLFSEFSYLGVSMNDIAKKLNITKAALYHHFTGKAEIYEKVLDEVFNSLSLSISEAFSEKTIDRKLHKLIKNYLDFGFKEKNLIKALMLKLSPTNPQIRKHIIKLRKQTAELIRPLIKEMITNKKLTPKVNSKLVTSLLTGMMDGLLLEYSFLNKEIDSEKVSSQIISVLF
jgi:AcrR family transcriptional regulator